MRIRILFGVIALLFTWSTFVSVTFAQGRNPVIGSLRGLQGVEVMVEDVDPEAERDGLTRNQLQVIVESELRKAGIKLLTREERFSAPGDPFLYIRVATHKAPTEMYGFSISVQLRQGVALLRNPSFKTRAVTWHYSTVGIVGASNLQDIFDHLKDTLDIFINDYLSVNPKHRGT